MRLRPLTRRITGDDRPKQFCPLLGDDTLLEQTLRRVRRLLPPQRCVALVVRAHERFYTPLLADLPAECVVVQPDNRGTAAAILYGLLRLATMDVPGPVAIVPSDHYVSNDDAFMAHIDQAFQAVCARPELLVLLGIAPDTPEVEYGWIEPGEPVVVGPRASNLFRVRRFWEKPPLMVARSLLDRGCLWNSFVTVGHPTALVALMRRALPGLVQRFTPLRARLATPWEGEAVRRLYAQLVALDFSKHVLAIRPANLAVLTLKDVAWSDLGHPGGVAAALVRTGARPAWANAVPA